MSIIAITKVRTKEIVSNKHNMKRNNAAYNINIKLILFHINLFLKFLNFAFLLFSIYLFLY